MALSAKQLAFVDEYLVDFNAAQAAIRAGYNPKTVNDYASVLRNRPDINAEISRRQQERSQQCALNKAQVIQEIARLAFNDPRQAFDANGALLPVQDWPDSLAACVASVKVLECKTLDGITVGEVKEIRFWDKGKQLELASRHLGLLKDRLEVSTPVAQLIKSARERLRDR